MPLRAERSQHLIVSRFPILRFFLPDFFNLPVLFLRDAATRDLFIPVAGILPIASGVLLNVLTERGQVKGFDAVKFRFKGCLLYTSPSPRDGLLSRMPSSA